MPPNKPSPQWLRDEEFRQGVIRSALLLGFTADEDNGEWTFRMFNEKENMVHAYGGYRRLYNAAYDYLRLLKIPHEVIGDFRG